MNKAICYSNLTLSHKKHPLQFTVGLGFQGKLINGRVKGIDLNKERKELEDFNSKIRDKEIFELIKDYKGMESLAQFYFKKLKNKKIDFIIIKENNTEEVIIEK
ncbi:MAG TPA: hypothetical protein PK685_01190 [archaeon]|nr:hypothetical protein [archaeon]